MLREPYNLIAKKDYNNYYYLDLHDTKQSFLAVESVEFLDENKKRFLRKPKVTPVEVTQNLKLLPLTSLTLYYMVQFLEINKIETVDVGGMEPEDIYGVWDEFDITDLKVGYEKLVANALKKEKGEYGWLSPKTIKNPVAKAFDRDGYNFIGIDKPSSFVRNYWLVRTSPQGNLTFVMVKEAGIDSNTITVGSDMFVLDRGLCHRIVSDFGLKDYTFVDDLNEEENKDK